MKNRVMGKKREVTPYWFTWNALDYDLFVKYVVKGGRILITLHGGGFGNPLYGSGRVGFRIHLYCDE